MVKTIHEARRLQYRVFPDDPDNRQANALKYVEHLGQVTSTDISSWPIDIFKNSEDRLYSERQKINEIFFQWKSKVASTPEVKPLDIAQVQSIETSLMNTLESQLVAHKRRLQRNLEHLESVESTAASAQRDVMAQRILLESLEKTKKTGFNVANQIPKILADGFWSLGDRSGALSFISPPQTLSFFNAAQRRTQAVHLGSLELRIHAGPRGLNCSVYKYKGAEHNLDNAHPHVSAGGDVCFGELRSQASLAMATLDIVTLCSLVQEVIKTYNEDDAYVHIHHFESGDPDKEEEYDDPDYLPDPPEILEEDQEDEPEEEESEEEPNEQEEYV